MSRGLGKGWFSESKRHSEARRLGAGEVKAIAKAAGTTAPRGEINDYLNVSQPIMASQKRDMAKTHNHLLSHYHDFALPTKEEVQGVDFKFEHIRETTPIILKTKKGRKIVEYTSGHLGAWYEPDARRMRMDPRLKGRNNWALRKALIGHEFQHIRNDDEDAPSAVHTLLRQNLLIPKGDMIRIGTMEEFLGLADKYGKKGAIQREFDKSPAKTDIMKYSFRYEGKKYAIARDVAFLDSSHFEAARRKYGKPVSRVRIEQKIYRAMPFRYANVLEVKG